MERVVTGARHVEVQLIADRHGTVWAVGVRDCSLQRRNQKVIEESHCIALTPEQDRDLRSAAVRLATAAGYENAGTVEFLFQPAEQLFAFLEVNTRLQVEHPVTELTTGLDLVKLQIHVASGGRLVGDPPPSEGYAIDDARALEVVEAPHEQRAGDAGQPAGDVVEAGVAEHQLAHDERGPAVGDDVAAHRDRAEPRGVVHHGIVAPRSGGG